jgi:hypothetical protein
VSEHLIVFSSCVFISSFNSLNMPTVIPNNIQIIPSCCHCSYPPPPPSPHPPGDNSYSSSLSLSLSSLYVAGRRCLGANFNDSECRLVLIFNFCPMGCPSNMAASHYIKLWFVIIRHLYTVQTFVLLLVNPLSFNSMYV